jgi:hypothetical protein
LRSDSRSLAGGEGGVTGCRKKEIEKARARARARERESFRKRKREREREREEERERERDVASLATSSAHCYAFCMEHF